jgi:hypothetical protein
VIGFAVNSRVKKWKDFKSLESGGGIMKTYKVTASAIIKAPADEVYALIANYHDGHPLILPKPYFVSLKVEEGGIGAGTIIRCRMRVLGRAQDFRAAITEPEPGRVLVETNLEAGGAVTTFTVEPGEKERLSQVWIATKGKVRDGLPGSLERLMTKMFLRRIYDRELKLLAALFL